ncbi:tetratricopeptide repeat protein [Luteibacter aegosomatis]|uniref:tetratricopeptide repeat protein n=1 Tax=Luteibacter aegosomatis TaxID=2911537 RepID=UPI001FFA64BD|nr:tetratricopeptide repeat protein [Luteibacter aegosomatis]UPG87385.1 tetratricopeptide repeat protein [Luteibacter aegosomatis]
MAMGWARWSAVAGMAWLAGCASQGTLPPAVPAPADVATERADADRAYASGDIARAAKLYEAVVGALPDDADAWYRLGNARFRLQQSDAAVTAYDRAVQLDPRHARALYNLGVVRLKQAQAALLSSAEASPPGDSLRRDGARMAQRIARAGDDHGRDGRTDGGAPPFIVEPDDAIPGNK